MTAKDLMISKTSKSPFSAARASNLLLFLSSYVLFLQLFGDLHYQCLVLQGKHGSERLKLLETCVKQIWYMYSMLSISILKSSHLLVGFV